MSHTPGIDDDLTTAETTTASDELHETPKKKLGLAHRLYVGDISWDFIAHRRLFFAISAAAIALSIGALLFVGLKLGIEFKGGADFTAPTQVNAQTVDTFRTAVQDTKIPDLDSTEVVTIGSGQVKVETRTLTSDEVTKVKGAIASTAGVSVDQVNTSLIGASWGNQITGKAVQALVVFLVLVSLLIWAYFRDWRMSIAALVALIHDLIITVGIYALVGFTVTPSTLIGVLTILGYSLYDTVVVFDKVKENVQGLAGQRRSYSDAANAAVNQVLVRSLNTTVIAVLPVAALLYAGAFVLGSGPLEDLGLALFVGLIAGAYSSIFIATPVLAWLKELDPSMKEHRARLERRQGRNGAEQPKVALSAAPAAASSAARTTTTVRTSRTGAPVGERTARTAEASTGSGSTAAPRPSTRNQPTRSSRSARKGE